MTDSRPTQSINHLQQHRRLILFIVCAILATLGWMLNFLGISSRQFGDALALVAAIVGGFPIVYGSIKALLDRDFGVDLLASIAIVAAMLASEYLSAVIVVLMLTGGEMLEEYTVRKTHQAIGKLIELTPKVARVRRDGKEIEVPVEEVGKGDLVLVKPGGRIPVDGKVVKGHASVNQSSITGESIPVEKEAEDQVFAGTLIELGALEIEVTKIAEESVFARIVQLMKKAQESRAPVEKAADRYARWFVPSILTVTMFAYLMTGNVIAAVSTLLIACPCALTLATPTAVVAAIGNGARRGILIKDGATLERVSNVDVVILDKTGTLTTGKPKVTNVIAYQGRSEREIISLAAVAEKLSEHPFAKAILKKAEELGADMTDPSHFEVMPGAGVLVRYDEKQIAVGNIEILKKRQIAVSREVEKHLTDLQREGKTPVIVCEDGSIVGLIGIADVAREKVAESIGNIRDIGIKNVVMLTGDNPSVAKAIAEEASIHEVNSGLLPEQKVAYVKRLKENGRKVLMVGDGINDAPALATADVGIAMGDIGTDVAIETADIVLMTDDIDKISQTVRLGRQTLAVIRQNILFAMIVNILGIILAANGVISPTLAAMVHEGNALLVVFNSARLIR